MKIYETNFYMLYIKINLIEKIYFMKLKIIELKILLPVDNFFCCK